MSNAFEYALLALLWPAMAQGAQVDSWKVYSEPDSARIYEVLSSARHQKVLTLTTNAQSGTCSVNPKEIPDPAFREAMEAFNDVNKQNWDLSEELRQQRTISETEIGSIFKPGIVEGWKQFRQRYPDFAGYVAFSAVGFDKAHTVAVVYSQGQCGAHCGAGGLQYFRRTPKGWRRIKTSYPGCFAFS
jgi:hypothetical protein